MKSVDDLKVVESKETRKPIDFDSIFTLKFKPESKDQPLLSFVTKSLAGELKPHLETDIISQKFNSSTVPFLNSQNA